MRKQIKYIGAIVLLLTIKLSYSQSLVLEKNIYSVSYCKYCSNLEEVFKSADKNKDGTIDIPELRSFQRWLMSNYEYKTNTLAIPPNSFVLQGGGDCEDFAAMTCCMLNSYGIVAYVATFGKVTVNKHAVCMVKVNRNSYPGMLIYRIYGWYSCPDGYYLPVDYNKVGGLSAIDRRWKIASMNTPNSIFFTTQ